MRSNAPEIEILLATCNGEQFLREQIDSILGQDYEHFRVLARDDGSSDLTNEILNDYAARFPNRFRVLPSGSASGSAKENFLRLMKASTADYICLSDQDDVWLPDKVRRTKEAMDRLESECGVNLPLLVFTDLRVVDDKLGLQHPSFWAFMSIDPDRVQRLNKLLVQGVVTGCTAMLNRQLLELSLSMPEEASMHDRWIALLASTLGRHAAVRAPTVLYRQHGGNVLGTGALQQPRTLLQRILRPDTQKYLEEWGTNQRQAAALLRIHSAEMAPGKRRVIVAFLRCGSSKNRIIRVVTFLRYGFYRAGILPNLILMVNLSTKRLGVHQVS